MNRRQFLGTSLAAGVAAHVSVGEGRSAPTSTTTGFALPVLGSVKPRAARAIRASSWSIGGETLDRDYASYEAYRQYLGPLGAKAIRLQAGWAKCERTSGAYSWEWLDAIVNDAVAQGVRPWLELSYGNPVYQGGGDAGLGGGFPTSAEALAAWDVWVGTCVARYADRVGQWEVWNEPDINKKGTAPVEGYVDLYTRTATIVRKVQPKGRLFALALAHKLEYAEQFLRLMKERQRLDLIDAITTHTYPRNPDTTDNIDALRAMITRTGAAIEVRQGETGAPSGKQSRFALSQIAWTESMQAKWNLRRMLAHHVKGVPVNLFSLSDMHYRGSSGRTDMNYKGLLATNPDKSIAGVKLAYRAAQTLFTIFDDTLEVTSSYPFTSDALRELALHGFRRKGEGDQVVVYWFKDAPPDDSTGTTGITVALNAGRFVDPVLVDVRTSTVWTLPRQNWSRTAKQLLLKDVPAYDSPMLIAERGTIELAAG